MKRVALSLLVVAAAVFVACTVFSTTPNAGWIGFLRAASEAAMVGGLADWFAVTALFRKPFGLPIPHTGIIPERKNEIGESLGSFVQQYFLDPNALASRVAEASPSASLVKWIRADDNASIVSRTVVQVASGVAQVLDADEVVVHLQHGVTEAVQSLDAGRTIAQFADAAIADGRGDQILSGVLGSVIRTLEGNRDSLRLGFAVRSPWWVPGSVDERVFEKLFAGIVDLLREVKADPQHELRQSLLVQANDLIDRLRTDQVTRDRAAQLRDEALAHPNVSGFVRSAWDAMCQALLRTADDEAGDRWCPRIESLVLRGAATLDGDEALQHKVDTWAASVVRTAVSEHGHRAAEWISSTVQQWDPTETSQLIENQIGRDLQFVRINGTVVGALVGLTIHAVSQLLS